VSDLPTLAPGARIGILGGGQLGRMLALAAAPLGYRCHIFCPQAGSPAAQVAAAETVAGYEDIEALRSFAGAVDLVTYEFENVPLVAIDAVAALRPVRPGRLALAMAQDRLLEKCFVRDLGIATAPFAEVSDQASLAGAVEEIGCPAVLKTRRFGYDGKGQALVGTPDAAPGAWVGLGGPPAILEGFVEFRRELSVLAARAADGAIATYDVVENRHREHILHTTRAPAPDAASVAGPARSIAEALLTGLDYVGVIGVELFQLADGGLLVNEFAPRVHNSGHWTIEGAATSQFEQHIRAVAGLPLGSPETLFEAEMTNLIGTEVEAWREILAEPGAHLHLYGKAEVRPGRKMGHVTRIRRRGGRAGAGRGEPMATAGHGRGGRPGP
jgi:5-(carboxyamino)imidazole ribonucleotide synthase